MSGCWMTMHRNEPEASGPVRLDSVTPASRDVQPAYLTNSRREGVETVRWQAARTERR